MEVGIEHGICGSSLHFILMRFFFSTAAVAKVRHETLKCIYVPLDLESNVGEI